MNKICEPTCEPTFRGGSLSHEFVYVFSYSAGGQCLFCHQWCYYCASITALPPKNSFHFCTQISGQNMQAATVSSNISAFDYKFLNIKQKIELRTVNTVCSIVNIMRVVVV